MRPSPLRHAPLRLRERDDPANAFYQEGELADEAARVCIDNGDLSAAAR
jgi:hypothetical protein